MISQKELLLVMLDNRLEKLKGKADEAADTWDEVGVGVATGAEDCLKEIKEWVERNL